MPIGPAEDCREISGGRRRTRRHGLQPGSRVAEERDRAGAAGADDQVFLAIAVEIDPGDARTELTERIGEQQLTPIIVKIRLDVGVAAELRRNVLEHRA